MKDENSILSSALHRSSMGNAWAVGLSRLFYAMSVNALDESLKAPHPVCPMRTMLYYKNLEFRIIPLYFS